jgi:hypothetical protein
MGMCSRRQTSQVQVLSAHLLLHQQALSARPPPEDRKSGSYPPFLSFYILVNHISEYVSVIFSKVESFAIRQQWHLTVDLRFNGSIN